MSERYKGYVMSEMARRVLQYPTQALAIGGATLAFAGTSPAVASTHHSAPEGHPTQAEPHCLDQQNYRGENPDGTFISTKQTMTFFEKAILSNGTVYNACLYSDAPKLVEHDRNSVQEADCPAPTADRIRQELRQEHIKPHTKHVMRGRKGYKRKLTITYGIKKDHFITLDGSGHPQVNNTHFVLTCGLGGVALQELS